MIRFLENEWVVVGLTALISFVVLMFYIGVVILKRKRLHMGMGSLLVMDVFLFFGSIILIMKSIVFMLIGRPVVIVSSDFIYLFIGLMACVISSVRGALVRVQATLGTGDSGGDDDGDPLTQ